MTLAEFAYLLDADPKWVQNAAATLGGSLRYTLPTARRLAIARALAETTDMPLPRAYAIAGKALRKAGGSRAPVRLSDEADPVAVTVDVFRILAAVSVGLSRLRTMYAPRRRGRPATLQRDPIGAAEEYGLDLGLMAANLRRTPAERLRQLDAMADFRRRAGRGHRRP
jgi:hypothetical protein